MKNLMFLIALAFSSLKSRKPMKVRSVILIGVCCMTVLGGYTQKRTGSVPLPENMYHSSSLSPNNWITFGNPDNFTTQFGRLSYGVNPIHEAGKAKDIDFFLTQGVKPVHNGYFFYGMGKNHDGGLSVWRAFTKDGYKFSHNKRLFDLPPAKSGTRWLTSQLAVGDTGIILIQLAAGKPARKGHPFFVFGSGSGDDDWRSLQSDPVYKGQDALHIAWNKKLGKYVNYQTAYQVFNKRFPDNISPVRRVLHIRTSPDGIHWNPGNSFGVDGPYLSNDQLILPDSLDTEDTEFYKFAAIDLDGFWAGIMVKYVAQPEELPLASPWPHGPFLSYEWWISKDGLTWARPFRENSGLDNAPYELAYRLNQPILVSNEWRWVINKKIYTIGKYRMFYTYSRANAEILTNPIQLTGRAISLDVDFFERDANYPSNLRGALKQGYVMAELVDSTGNVIPGFERSKCIFQVSKDKTLTLKWGRELLPENYKNNSIRVRILFRDVKLYSLQF